ncbi:putative lipid-transfer protein DIR1 [Ziziphus jujuba]|uniref:Lipid-transfer protein DIR1 n=2 Tax=Ziziphus jujuba TaxID=326968 RepID=A0A6P4ARF5_ZIZJJ|nr:putative lipid-transfer protein DIR1 [Ziziphus jujuba]KAH7546815.1 hypothetical protein FEM48_Zijuj01G0241100 [Ziziphus jujuba var. spinosa]
MGRTGGKVLVVHCLMRAVLFTSLLCGGSPITFCNIDTNQLNDCLPAVRGMSPPPPTQNCCDVIHQAYLPCLCSYLPVLPMFGIDPVSAVALPNKCGLETPRECHVP